MSKVDIFFLVWIGINFIVVCYFVIKAHENY